MRLSRPLTVALLSALLLAACGEAEDTRPGQPVKTRQTAFKEIIKVFEPMGVMLRGKRYEEEKFLRLATALHEKRDGPWAHFGADTNYPPTKATPLVWQEPERFARERDSFLKATDELLAAARSKDQARIQAAYDAVHASCQDCHKPFKTR